MAFFWPERSPDAARHALSQTLYRLHDVGREWLDTQGDQFTVSAGPGGATVWTVPARGGPLRQYRATRVSPGLKLAWAPGDQLLYQRPDNRNFYRLDASTEQVRPLVLDDPVGWMFWPQYSPDGSRVAVYWNRRDGASPGIWLILLEDESQTLLMPELSWEVLRWTPDGTGVVLRSPAENGLYVLPIDVGERRLLGRLPPGCADVAVTADMRHVVCQRMETERDVWLAENFDPRSRDR